jgi:hypothetical protein
MVGSMIKKRFMVGTLNGCEKACKRGQRSSYLRHRKYDEEILVAGRRDERDGEAHQV